MSDHLGATLAAMALLGTRLHKGISVMPSYFHYDPPRRAIGIGGGGQGKRARRRNRKARNA